MNISRAKVLGPVFLTAVCGGVLVARNLFYWDLYSVDVLYWDQWDFWRPMLEGDAGLWSQFNHQHGPHKMGLGYFVLSIVAWFSDWNVRTEALALILVSAISAVCFLWLKWRLFRRWDWGDASIPALCLFFGHYEIYFIGTNPGLNVVPLFLIAVIGLFLSVKERWAKYVGLCLLGFCASYTGFAIFAGLLVPLFCGWFAARSFWRERKLAVTWRPALACLVSGLGFWSYFWDYRFIPAAAEFRFPHDPLGEYPVFVAKYWGHFFNLGNDAFWMPALAVVTLSVVCVGVCIGVFQRRCLAETGEGRRRDVILFLCLFSLLFSINVAIGRVSFGVGAGMVSRYLTFLVPLWIAGYFLVLQVGPKLRIVLSACLLALLFRADRSFESSRTAGLETLAAGKREWVSAYLEYGDIATANKASGFKVYPFEWAYERQEGYIRFLKENGLGFMKPVD